MGLTVPCTDVVVGVFLHPDYMTICEYLQQYSYCSLEHFKFLLQVDEVLNC